MASWLVVNSELFGRIIVAAARGVAQAAVMVRSASIDVLKTKNCYDGCQYVCLGLLT